jgi:hypothetical protein
VTRTTQQLANLRGELAKLIGGVSFELAATPQTTK